MFNTYAELINATVYLIHYKADIYVYVCKKHLFYCQT